MVKIHWKIHQIPRITYKFIQENCKRCRYTLRCLTFNQFMDQSYAADVCMEPLFWFVDNFTYALGPFFVLAVSVLTSSVIIIAYWIGLPYWWNKNPYLCCVLLVVGNWLIANIAFHYYMAVQTHPGHPPQGELITEAVSICKKCIAPKPPRTHHCSVCNRCILKMDHHCPWLNNCVGYKNHRYFFMYMVYMIIGVTFLIVFGAEIAYAELWLNSAEPLDDPELVGHPVKFNKTGAMIPVTDDGYDALTVTEVYRKPLIEEPASQNYRRRSIIYMTLINCGVLIALGGLTIWHSRLIADGKTSIEANINAAEAKRLRELGKVYVNPYNFGRRQNWLIFLGLVQNRSWFWHIILPSAHPPLGDGLTWHTVKDDVQIAPICEKKPT